MDNPHITRASPYKLGEKKRRSLKLKLVASTGIQYPYEFIHRHEMDWNDKKMIAMAHKWRKQVIDRTLDKHHGPGVDSTKKTRPHWTEREQGMCEVYIRNQIREKRARLTKVDWEIISRKHNAYFVGKEIKVGEKTPAGKNNKGGMTKAGKVKTAHILPARTINAIYSQAQRWPQTKEMIQEEYARLQVPIDEAVERETARALQAANAAQAGAEADDDDSSNSSDEDEDEEDLNVSGSPKGPDSDLEDSSDDEEDDQRPASNQSGARPIPTW